MPSRRRANGSRAAGSEDSTEARLEEAALKLLERNGVLAGLNLREVADEADVTRGLVYHHFGSRRVLLRAALQRSIGRRRSSVVRREKLRARERLEDFFAASVQDPVGIRLLAMLILDEDAGVNALPFAVETREANRRDVADGHLADDVDPDALQAGLIAAMYGWVIFRQSFAAALGRSPADLDPHVLEMLSRMWEARRDGAPLPEQG